jgi:hypothetical protein
MSTVPYEMATDTTRILSCRVPAEFAEQVEADAAALKMKPGTLIRKILRGALFFAREGRKT